MPSLLNRMSAEFFGTFWLVLGGCGSAVLAAAFPNVGIGLLGYRWPRPDGADHGLRHRPYFRLPSQSGGFAGSLGRGAFSRQRPHPLTSPLPGPGRHRRSRHTLLDRQW